jgi:predicted amidohydrolase YtcJ
MLDEISSDRAIVVFYSSGNQALVSSAAAKKIASLASAEKINITKDGFIQNEDLQHLLNLLINKEQATEAFRLQPNFMV